MSWPSRPPVWLVLTEMVAAALLGCAVWVTQLPSIIGAVTLPFDWVVYVALAMTGGGWLIGTAGLFLWLIRSVRDGD